MLYRTYDIAQIYVLFQPFFFFFSKSQLENFNSVNHFMILGCQVVTLKKLNLFRTYV